MVNIHHYNHQPVQADAHKVKNLKNSIRRLLGACLKTGVAAAVLISVARPYMNSASAQNGDSFGTLPAYLHQPLDSTLVRRALLDLNLNPQVSQSVELLAGSEFRVNTFTTSDQADPAIRIRRHLPRDLQGRKRPGGAAGPAR